VADNGFNYQLMGARGFEILTRLIESAGAWEFCYSSLPEALALFDRLAAGEW
jgi:hypothetical protein